MPLKLHDLVNKSSKKLVKKGDSVFTNPVYVAGITIGILLIIIWIMMKNEVEIIYEDTSFTTLLFKVGIWGFISSVFISFLHERSIEQKYEEKYANKMQEQVVVAVTSKDQTNSQETIYPESNSD